MNRPHEKFCDLPNEHLALLVRAQRRLLAKRRRNRISEDRRAIVNLRRIERLLKAAA
jgi:hypothetical protein